MTISTTVFIHLAPHRVRRLNLFAFSMTDLILFAVASVGMAAIIVHGSIFAPIRRVLATLAENYAWTKGWHNLATCMQCTGFWCGLFCGLILVTPTTIVWEPIPLGLFLIRWLCCGFAGSILSSFFDLVAEAVAIRNEMAKRELMSMPTSEEHHEYRETPS